MQEGGGPAGGNSGSAGRGLKRLPSVPRQELTLLGPGESLRVGVEGNGGSDVVTFSPVAEAGGVMLAPIGLVGMINAGGAVLRWGWCQRLAVTPSLPGGA